MKKILSLLVLLALVLGALPLGGIALAQDGLNVETLAQYFPGGTIAYAAIRTDDGYLDTLDGLLARVVSALPAEFQTQAAGVNMRALLSQAFNADFAAEVRPWLGDSLAAGLANLEQVRSDPPVVLALEVADRDRLLALMEDGAGLDADRYERTEDGDTVRWAFTGDDSGFWPDVALTPDVLLISNAAGALDSIPAANGLSADATFNDTLALLPAESYHIVGYVNVAALAPVAGQIAAQSGMPDDTDYPALFTALGQMAVGLTVLDGRVLTIDVAQNSDVAALAALGMPAANTTPVDLAFARRLPANAQFVIHSADFAASYQNAIASLSTAAELQGMDPEQVEQSMAMFNFMLQGALGLDLEDDLISWMTGNYALLLGVDPAVLEAIYTDPQSITGLATMPLYLGLVAEVTDPAAARSVVSTLAENIPDLLAMGEGDAAEQVQVSQESIGGGDVLVITLIPPDEQAAALLPPLELLVGTNDEVFALGTRNVVAFALEPGAGSLADHPDALDAADFLLPNPTAIALITGEGVQVLADLMIAINLILAPTIDNIFSEIITELDGGAALPTPTPGPSPAELAAQQAMMIRGTVAALVDLISNLTISSASDGDSSWTRFTLALTAE